LFVIFHKYNSGTWFALPRLLLQARPPAEQGEAAWGTSGQVTIGMLEYRNTGADRIKISHNALKPIIFTQPVEAMRRSRYRGPVKPETCLTGGKLFSISPGPIFPPGLRPYGPDANWGESPEYIYDKKTIIKIKKK
jgi:hypothetical protein